MCLNNPPIYPYPPAQPPYAQGIQPLTMGGDGVCAAIAALNAAVRRARAVGWVVSLAVAEDGAISGAVSKDYAEQKA